MNNESCSESEVKEDDDIGTESSRSHGKAGNKGDPSLSGNYSTTDLYGTLIHYKNRLDSKYFVFAMIVYFG